MPRTMIAVALAAAALLIGTPPATAESWPTFECDQTIPGDRTRGWGVGNCTGTPLEGPIHGDFDIRSRTHGDPWYRCWDIAKNDFPSGLAELPRRVSGLYCEPLAESLR